MGSIPVVLLVNGPNLNTLGTREPQLYGSTTLAELASSLEQEAAAGTPAIELRHFQSNHEGAILDFLHEHGPAAAGVILNGGALTHYSYALRDGISAIAKPMIEVHLTNIHARESFRHTSVTAPVAIGQIAGLGISGYSFALEWFRRKFAEEGRHIDDQTT
jgi:3-dehydroquinate dehydratase-2